MTPVTLPDHPGALAGALETAVLDVAADGRPMQVASLAVDYAAPVGGPLSIEASVDRATRSLVFARAQARNPDGAIAATASAVLRVVGA
jgi:acyl-coenzyme A thioesterase PaaI-like protein